MATPVSGSECGRLRFLCRLCVPGQSQIRLHRPVLARSDTLADGAVRLREQRPVDGPGDRPSPAAGLQGRHRRTRDDVRRRPRATSATRSRRSFSSDERSSFACRPTRQLGSDASRPSRIRLSRSAHRFEVRAADEAGNAEASPAARTWQVLKAGGTIPGVEQQAVALAGAIARMRRTLSHTSLRRLYRKRSVTLRGFRTLTAGELECRVTTRIRLRSGRYRRVALLRGRRSAPGAGDYSVAAELTKQGRRLVRRRRQLVVTLRLTFTDRAGRSLWAQMDATMTR